MKKFLHSHLFGLTLMLVLGIFFSFYHLDKLYGFEFDQERDYYIVKDIVVNHKFTLIGPRVVSSAGFYLGPWYYYLQVPFFILLHGDPLYGAFFTGIVNLAVGLLMYLVIWQGTRSRLLSFLAALLYMSGANRSNWNVSFVPFFFLLFLYFYFRLIKKWTFSVLWLLTLSFFLSLNFHPQMIFLLPVWLWALSRHKLSLKQIIFLVVAVLSPLLPLVFFDLRHNFVNTLAAIRFLTTPSSASSAISFFRPLYSLRQFSTALMPLYSGFQHNLFLTAAVLLALFVFTLKNKEYFFLVVTCLLSLFVLSFYREPTWPEYYQFVAGLSVFILVFFAASKISLLKWPFIALAVFVVYTNFNFLKSYTYPGSYYYKKAMILYMLDQNKPYEKLNIINDFRYGEGLGFQPIREFYESKTGRYHPLLKFYVSYVESPKHNTTKQAFGYYAISLVKE